jgi:hypothetical protein
MAELGPRAREYFGIDEPETPTGRAIRMIREEERERCAKVAEEVGRDLGEPAIGGRIADKIREFQS